jgi:hypothetical protein
MLQIKPMHFAPALPTNHLVAVVDDIKNFFGHGGRVAKDGVGGKSGMLKQDDEKSRSLSHRGPGGLEAFI